MCLAILKHPTIANQFPHEIKMILVMWRGGIISAFFNGG